jgi:glutamate/tyrosine decarboxylase-like PLP-dependent enzyme
VTFPPAFDARIAEVLAAHRSWESNFSPFEDDATTRVAPELLAAATAELCTRLRENYPHFHPLYAGQMLKPPHPVAVVGYLAAMLVNPNNHALDGGRATAAMEKEAVAEIAAMFGYEGDGFLGHLTSSGTIANLEALWIARELAPEKAIAIGAEAHYTHRRACELLRVPVVVVASHHDGTMDLDDLDRVLERGDVGTVVATLGTTALGALDPLPAIVERAHARGVRVHVDAAYGGYFRLLAGEDPACEPFRATPLADSIVVDPHKHGLQPYGCGCVLFRDGAVAKTYAHDSPYTYFSSPLHHPGETTFECSRAGAAAAALWMTLRCFPLHGEAGGMKAIVAKCRKVARSFATLLGETTEFATLLDPSLDIVAYFAKAPRASEITASTDRIFERAASAAEPLHLAKLEVEAERFRALCPDVDVDVPKVRVLRSCLMKPEQAEWSGRIVELLRAAR